MTLRQRLSATILAALLFTVAAVVAGVVTAPSAKAQTCGTYCDRSPYPWQVVGCYQWAFNYSLGRFEWRLICI